jgi:hypothetical protein
LRRKEGGTTGREGRREGERKTYLNKPKALRPIELVLHNGNRDDTTVRSKHALDVLLAHLEGGREGGGKG